MISVKELQEKLISLEATLSLRSKNTNGQLLIKYKVKTGGEAVATLSFNQSIFCCGLTEIGDWRYGPDWYANSISHPSPAKVIGAFNLLLDVMESGFGIFRSHLHGTLVEHYTPKLLSLLSDRGWVPEEDFFNHNSGNRVIPINYSRIGKPKDEFLGSYGVDNQTHTYFNGLVSVSREV